MQYAHQNRLTVEASLQTPTEPLPQTPSVFTGRQGWGPIAVRRGKGGKEKSLTTTFRHVGWSVMSAGPADIFAATDRRPLNRCTPVILPSHRLTCRARDLDQPATDGQQACSSISPCQHQAGLDGPARPGMSCRRQSTDVCLRRPVSRRRRVEKERRRRRLSARGGDDVRR